MNREFILEMAHITKFFPGVKALEDVSFNLSKGEIHALVGENGAGKSTLMKILGGVYVPDSGELRINGMQAKISNPSDSLKYGVGIIYQEFNLVPTLSVGENIFLGKELTKGKLKALDRSAMNEKAKEAIGRLGLEHIDCSSPVKELSIAQQQLIEISKALYNNAQILVMDEPTAVLTEKETEALFTIVESLKASGVSIIYISHRLEEIERLSDRITVLRDGKLVTTLDNRSKSVSKDEIIKLMVGRDLEDYFPARQKPVGKDKVLEVEGLLSKGHFQDVSFTVKKGEIVGFAGLVGAGRTEVMKALFGAIPCDGGKLSLGGNEITVGSPMEAIKLGIGLVPEDRKHEGLVLDMTLSDNICLPNLEKVSVAGCVVRKKKKGFVEKFVDSLSIRPQLPDRQVRDFSGGNQQKAVISKWLAINPRVLILDEPTRGIDVGAKAEIYNLIRRLTEQGVSIILVSSELLEVLGICDRILVMCEGRITGEFTREEATQEKIMKAASGN